MRSIPCRKTVPVEEGLWVLSMIVSLFDNGVWALQQWFYQSFDTEAAWLCFFAVPASSHCSWYTSHSSQRKYERQLVAVLVKSVGFSVAITIRARDQTANFPILICWSAKYQNLIFDAQPSKVRINFCSQARCSWTQAATCTCQTIQTNHKVRAVTAFTPEDVSTSWTAFHCR